MPIEITFGVGTLVLLAAIAWGIHQSRTRDRAKDPLTDRATRNLYQRDEIYDRDRELRGEAIDSERHGSHTPNIAEARQGETSNHMRWVLLASLVLAVFLLGTATYVTR